jgi:SAM-dependent methyltransferase
MRIIDDLAYALLARCWPRGGTQVTGTAYADRSKLGVLLGDQVWRAIQGRTVVDFGCGTGAAAVELAQRGAARVIGVDIRESVLEAGRQRAREVGVSDRCTFTTDTRGIQADVILSLDAFEHFADPVGVLVAMDRMLAPDGIVLAAFGPTWYHPLGGHLFSPFPWAHLVLPERALMRWRSTFKSDGATRFSEVEGGLNQMTLARFEAVVRDSPLEIKALTPVPIRRLRRLASKLTREWTTAVVRCELQRRPAIVAGQNAYRSPEGSMKRSALVGTALLAMGCVTVQPPPVAPPSPDVHVRAPFDTVWQRTVAFFADNRISIQTIDKNSGLIVSNGFLLTPTITREWVDCGTTSAGEPAVEMYYKNANPVSSAADFNVFVRPVGDSTVVRVNMGVHVTATTLGGPVPQQCVSRGVFERALYRHVGAHTQP